MIHTLEQAVLSHNHFHSWVEKDLLQTTYPCLESYQNPQWRWSSSSNFICCSDMWMETTQRAE